jgi:choline kinase
MQAIILAAGMGKRLGELTKDNTKCMVKVNQRNHHLHPSALTGAHKKLVTK